MPSSRESSQPRDQTQVSHIAGQFFTVWATNELKTLYDSLVQSQVDHFNIFGVELLGFWVARGIVQSQKEFLKAVPY